VYLYGKRINILQLANYFSLEALPASRLDAGDVDKLEYQVAYAWMPAGHLDVASSFVDGVALKTLGLLEVGLTVADGGQCGEHPLFQLVLEVNFIDELLCRPRILLQIF
jgi:hypothetical protein